MVLAGSFACTTAAAAAAAAAISSWHSKSSGCWLAAELHPLKQTLKRLHGAGRLSLSLHSLHIACTTAAAAAAAAAISSWYSKCNLEALPELHPLKQTLKGLHGAGWLLGLHNSSSSSSQSSSCYRQQLLYKLQPQTYGI
jgi:hypothetical protein